MKSLVWLVLSVLAGAIGCTGGRVSETLLAKPVEVKTLETPVLLSAAPSFGDERGGGLFIDLAGQVVRLRANGAPGLISPHPLDPVFPGPARSIAPLGPYTGLVSTTRGLFVAENGWLIAPLWQDTLSAEGLVATAVAASGTGWLAHEKGLFRIESGGLSELKVDAASLEHLSALAVGPGPDARDGVWFAQGTTLTSAAQSTSSGFIVRDSGLTAKELEGGVVALAGIAESVDSPGEVWAITPKVLFQFTVLGWRKFDLGHAPKQLMSAGRFAWLQAGDGLYRYDADSGSWAEARGLDAVPTLVAVDAAGSAWVRVKDRTLAISLEHTPRVQGLFQNATVYEPELVITTSLPSATTPTELSWAVDGAEPTPLTVAQGAAGSGAQAGSTFWSLAGVDAAGKAKPVSFNALADGAHVLKITAKFDDGSTGERQLYFGFSGSANATLSWTRDLKPISDDRCAKCHTTGTQPELATFEEWKENATLISAAVRDKRMPADGPLDPAKIQLIQRWVNGGTLP